MKDMHYRTFTLLGSGQPRLVVRATLRATTTGAIPVNVLVDNGKPCLDRQEEAACGRIVDS
jgi:hypothetical protein